MKSSSAIAATVVLFVVIIATSLFEGYHTERFVNLSNAQELADMAERIKDLPLSFGNWRGEIVPDTPELARQYEMGNYKGHCNINYKNTISQKVVQVSLLCAHRRHAVIHRPDQCMIGHGYNFKDEERPYEVDVEGTPSGKVYFRTAEFELLDNSRSQRMLWCWGANNAGGDWIAPEAIKLGLWSDHYWYKLYITVPTTAGQKDGTVNAADEFVREFIPKANGTLFRAAAEPATTSKGA